jgi:hypothetical protein
VKRRISAKSVLEDMRSGMNEAELTAKHGLSLKGLQRLFHELLHAQMVTHQYLYKRFPSYQERADQLKQRRARRVGLSVRLPACDLGSANFGIVRDISETGLRVAGIKYQVGDVATFQLPIDVFMNTEPLLVIAKCRWVSEKGNVNKYFVAGFELMDLSPADRKMLKEFINLLLLNKSGEWQTAT